MKRLQLFWLVMGLLAPRFCSFSCFPTRLLVRYTSGGPCLSTRRSTSMRFDIEISKPNATNPGLTCWSVQTLCSGFWISSCTYSGTDSNLNGLLSSLVVWNECFFTRGIPAWLCLPFNNGTDSDLSGLLSSLVVLDECHVTRGIPVLSCLSLNNSQECQRSPKVKRTKQRCIYYAYSLSAFHCILEDDFSF